MSTESEEDDNFGTEEAHHAIIQSLGTERRHRVLAGLYMGRYVYCRCSLGLVAALYTRSLVKIYILCVSVFVHV